MPETGRLFLCARCRVQVVLCRRCDRGQVYCGRPCAAAARGQAQRAASERYQASRPGRFAHAARARRYRARCKIVTHQGSGAAGGDDLLPAEAVVPESDVVAAVAVPAPNCTSCGARCSAAVRIGFVRHHRRAPGRPTGAHRTAHLPDEHPP